MPDVQVIDIHIHTYTTRAIGMQAQGGNVGPSGHAGTIDELLPVLKKAGISHAAMVNFTPVADMLDAARSRLPADYTPTQRQEAEEPIRLQMVGRLLHRNVWTCDVAREHPGLIAFIGVDPVMDAEAMAREVHEKQGAGAMGIKIHPEVQRIAINDPRLWPAYRAAQETGMIVLSHTGAFRDSDGSHSHASMAADVLRAFPDLKMILAHLGGRNCFGEALQVAQAFPNVLFDCCGVLRQVAGGYSDDDLVGMFRQLGVHRVLYGSDWAFADPVLDLERMATLPLNDEEKRLILRDNAATLLGL
ncbi:MAG: amidohydrolase family protein [Dehalococcoidia bacterium]